MTSIIEIEQAAAKLRRYLRIAQSPDLKVICGLRFFDLFRDKKVVFPESYLREFLPILAEAAAKCRSRELFPEDGEALSRLIELASHQAREVPVAADLVPLMKLASPTAEGPVAERKTVPKEAVRVPCLFVEYYPDLDLPPRGRILDLLVTASPISAKAESDDIVVRNPMAEPDDRFLAQARDSVAAARKYLSDRYGLSSKKRYRFDFAVDSTGARFTGDSLGVAFAVGAVAAVARIEVFRERLSIASFAAFSGAMTADGKLNQIDGEALKRKIRRAFHSDLTLLVIPRAHITDAWTYLSELEKAFPGRKLELVGADSLAAIASDPRLVPPERFSTPAYLARKAWHAKRSAWVEYPAALLLISVLAYLILLHLRVIGFDWRIDHLEVLGNRFKATNPNGKTMWESGAFEFPLPQRPYDNDPKYTDKQFLPVDVDNDGKDELYFTPAIAGKEKPPALITLYDDDGTIKWTVPTCERTSYSVDTILAKGAVSSYVPAHMVSIVLNDGEHCVLTTASASYPARTQVMLLGVDGRKISGPYLQTGHESGPPRLIDIDGDKHPEVIMSTYNRRCMRAALVVLDPTNMAGVSPPYDDSLFLSSKMNRGSQKWYVLFPQTELVKGDIAPSAIEGIRFTDSHTCQVTVFYAGGMGVKVVGLKDENAGMPIPIDFILDENFIPVDVLIPDHTVEYFNILLSGLGKPQITDANEWRKQLLSDFIVYRGDSIVHHLSAGID
ncbi:MAG: hypothetical protein GYA46_07455, partial [candidate division Zixibacteria bacterium]|nr:hypothetical protein [candidate division Zixibacteria bacterium]